MASGALVAAVRIEQEAAFLFMRVTTVLEHIWTYRCKRVLVSWHRGHKERMTFFLEQLNMQTFGDNGESVIPAHPCMLVSTTCFGAHSQLD